MKWTGRFEGYHAGNFRRDLVSGLIVGIIAIPLGMAFAIASGVSPQYGIYTTVIAGFLISLLGGSKFQIGGPTGAFIPVLLAITLQHGYENLLVAGLMAGMLLVLMGVFKLGALIQFIPRPVTVGFTAGIAVIIFTGQIASFLGLSNIQKHEYFIPNMQEIVTHLSSANPYSISAAVISLTVMLLTPRFFPKIPGSLVGLVCSSIIAAWWMDGQTATIGSAYGAIPSTLPAFHWPAITLERMSQLIGPAFVIAMLGGIESLLSAVVADGMSGTRHHSNRELIGQGIANIVTPLFGGIPATGAIARTATNIRSGAASPISGMIHSLTVLLVLLAFAPWASRIPLASMAPILMVVAWNMSERKEFVHILRTRSGDSLVMLITFLLTVLTDLTIAVEVGLLAAAVWFMKRMSESLTVAKVLPDPQTRNEKVAEYIVKEEHDCPQISIFTVEGALFFGTSARFEQSVRHAVRNRPNIVLFRLGRVPMLDTSGESSLSKVVKEIEGAGGVVMISGIRPQPKALLQRTGLESRIGSERYFERTGEAITDALSRIDPRKCAGCRHFAFRECALLSASPETDRKADGS